MSEMGQRKLRYISLCSGIEAASVAFDPLGWEPVAFAEIEDFPSAVLAARWPDVPNLGDLTKVDWSKYYGSADLVIGGFPCQSYSIAGLRNGLADPRGQIMLECLAAIRDIDPEWAILENVPGILSSNGGRDFQTLLNAVAILWPRGGISWRILDAQWFGLAQRRRRVFAVINTRDWRRAAAVLLDEHCLCGDSPTRVQEGQTNAKDARGGAPGEVWAAGLTAFKWFAGAKARTMPTYDDGTTPTLTNSDSHQPAITYSLVTIQGDGTSSNGSRNGCGFSTDDLSYTLNTRDKHSVAYSQQPDDGPYVLASDHSGAEIGKGGIVPTILAHAAKGAPVLAMKSEEQS